MAILLRVILLLLIGQLVLRLVRVLEMAGRDTLPAQREPPLRPPAIDPRDIIDATYQEVEDDSSR